MHKKLNFKILSSIFFISTIGGCSLEKDPIPPKYISSFDKCHTSCENMIVHIDRCMPDKSGKSYLENLHNKKFAELYLDCVVCRSESAEIRQSIDKDLSRLWVVKGKPLSNEAITTKLSIISENVNNESSPSQFVVMGNTNGQEVSFSKLGKAFKSDGLEYILISLNGDYSVKNIFFSDRTVVKNFLTDKDGNVYDERSCLKTIDGNCIALPILKLRLRDNSSFVHLGGYWGDELDLSMFFSLVGAKAYSLRDEKAKKKKSSDDDYSQEEPTESRIFLFPDNNSSGSGRRNFFLQSSNLFETNAVGVYRGIFNLKDVFVDKICYERVGENNYIVFSDNPRSAREGVALQREGCFYFEEIADDLRWFSCRFLGKYDICFEIFNIFKSSNEQRTKLVSESEALKKEIETLRAAIDAGKKGSDETELIKKENDLRNKMAQCDKIPYLIDCPLKVTRIFCGSNSGYRNVEWENEKREKVILETKVLDENKSFSYFMDNDVLTEY